MYYVQKMDFITKEKVDTVLHTDALSLVAGNLINMIFHNHEFLLRA